MMPRRLLLLPETYRPEPERRLPRRGLCRRGPRWEKWIPISGHRIYRRLFKRLWTGPAGQVAIHW